MPSNPNKIIQIETGKHWISSDGFLCSQFRNSKMDRQFTIEDAKKHIAIMTRLAKGQPMPFLIDCRNVFGTMKFEASNFMADSPELKEIRLAEAFIVNSLAIRLIINYYIRSNRAGCPSKVFMNEQAGIEWLRTYKL